MKETTMLVFGLFLVVIMLGALEPNVFSIIIGWSLAGFYYYQLEEVKK